MQYTVDRTDVRVVIAHDEDWFALLTDNDIELPDGPTLIRRLSDSHRITVKNGYAYLLTQVKQKDAIIESLLRQLDHPDIATTPLPIASYTLAVSLSDSVNHNVDAWLDRLQSSVQSAESKMGGQASKLDGPSKFKEEEEEFNGLCPEVWIGQSRRKKGYRRRLGSKAEDCVD
ncbi:hypothetical protein L218DRAFT_955569 [Marasmius fiardii PR-910]|nr:hypothetical protein L218DRAFT_955569 [Marasmius fiardii PR-910]